MAGPIGDALGMFGGAAQALFAGNAAGKKADMYRIMGQADLLKRQGDLLEAGNYERAGELALKNKAYTEQSVAVQQAQADRSITMSLGSTRAAAGASGLAGESAVDVLAASSQQGALQKQVLAQQGLITEEGFQEQHDTYTTMAQVARLAGDAETLAAQGHMKAAEAEDDAARGNFFTAGIKALAGVAGLAFGGPLGGAVGGAVGNLIIPGNWGEQG